MSDLNILQCELLNFKFNSPIMVGSGPLTDSLGRIKKYFRFGAGAVIGKTIYLGDEVELVEKVHTTNVGLFNSTTYSKKTVEQWIGIITELSKLGLPMIPSLHAQTPQLMGSLIEMLNPYLAKMVELGISCPNDGSQQKGSAQLIYDYTSQAKRATKAPIIVKLGVAGDYLDCISAAIDAGASAISISDTLPAIAFDVHERKYIFNGPAGLSGPAIKPIVLHAIYQIRKAGITCPIIGIGGIQSADDVLEYLHVGANAVQIYTSLMYQSPDLITKINQDLISWCVKHNEKISAFKPTG